MEKLKNSWLIVLILVVFLAILACSYFLLDSSPSLDQKVNTQQIVAENEDNNELSKPNKLTVLISLDGMRPDLISEDTPFLSSLLQHPNTSYTLEAQTLKHSVTMPSHISMITGLTEEHHGFRANSVNESTPVFREKTLFDHAIENDYSYYAFFTKDKLLHILGGKSGDNIVSKEEFSNLVVNDIDLLINENEQDVFSFIHFRDMDIIGHKYGWNSPQQKKAVKTLDKSLETLITDLQNEFSDYQRYFIISADHGGEGKQHSDGCPACRKIPLIVVSEDTTEKYELSRNEYNIYDITCIVLNLMEVEDSTGLDCKF